MIHKRRRGTLSEKLRRPFEEHEIQGKWNSKDCDLEVWTVFEIQRMLESFEVANRFWLFAAATLLIAYIIRILLNTEVRTFSTCGMLVVIVCCHFFRGRCRQRILIVPRGSVGEWRWCVAHQISNILLTFCLMVMSTLGRSSTIMSHRSFLISHFFCLSLMVELFYIPRKWHVCLVTIPATLNWWLFHYYVLTWFNALSCFWGLALSLGAWYTSYASELRAWRNFQAVEHEKRLFQWSEALTGALRAMLDSAYDASCECDEKRLVLTASSHLQERLGMCDRDFLDVDIADLAANPCESQRLVEFFGQCMTNGFQQSVRTANLTQSTLRRKALCIGTDMTPTHEEVPLTITCVALPQEVLGATCCRLFMGLRFAQTLEVMQTTPALSTEVAVAPAQTKSCVGLPPDLTCTDLFAPRLLARLQDIDFKSEDSLSFTITQPTEAVLETEDPPERRHDLNVCTAEATTQTDPVRRPPRLPTSERQKKPVVMARTRWFSRSDKGLLSNFGITPTRTVELLLCDAMQRFNPDGRGCCAWHVCGHLLLESLKKFRARPCPQQFFPYDGWQCRKCFSLNESGDVDSDSDSEQKQASEECHLCGEARLEEHITECRPTTPRSSDYPDGSNDWSYDEPSDS